MRKLIITTLLAAGVIAAAPHTACAGTLHTNAVIVAAGQTNGVADITLAQPLNRDAAPGLNCVSVANVSGYGTGTVAFASYDFGHEIALASTNTIIPGASADIWPKRSYVTPGATNAEEYLVRTLRVRVTQATTNSTPTVYRIGALTR